MGKRNEIKAKDILLLLLYLPGKTENENEPIIGRTRITKMIYLFEEELLKKFSNVKGDTLPKFIAYNFGPFSKELLNDINFFVTIGFINEEIERGYILHKAELEDNIYDKEMEKYEEYMGEKSDCEALELENTEECVQESKYSLSEKGIKYVKEKLIDSNKFTEMQLDLLMRFKSKINSLTLKQLLTYVYKNYEDMTVNSKIKDKILGEE